MFSLASVASEVSLRIDSEEGIPKLKKAGVFEILKSSFDVMTQMLESGEDVSIPQFGKFIVKTQAARTARNPKTGKKIKVPEKQVVKFRISSVLRGTIAGK